jgi:hypothetical protein
MEDNQQPNSGFNPYIEDLLKHKIGFGRAQYLLVSTLALILLSIAAMNFSVRLLLPIYKVDWHFITIE